jgi:hypothetical protein
VSQALCASHPFCATQFCVLNKYELMTVMMMIMMMIIVK